MPVWDIRRVEETGSTNADLRELAKQGAPEGTVLVALHQTAGRGRLDRQWVTPPGYALTFSMLLYPSGRGDSGLVGGNAGGGAPCGDGVPTRRWNWIPLLAGCSVVDGIFRTTKQRARLKWPNDVLLEAPDSTPEIDGGPAHLFSRTAKEKKVCGILAERVDDAIVLGIGVNVSTPADELPVPTATSLLAAGAVSPDREVLLERILEAVGTSYEKWKQEQGDPETSDLRDAYRERCATLGRNVRVEVMTDSFVEGTARDIDLDGRLVVDTTKGEVAFGAGDVVHVR